jgi:glycosyltransferase involved in cell wall biosynthesis
VAFNSQFHRDSLFAALPGFLNSFPDRRHHHLIESVAARSEVLPVGIDLRRLDSHRPDRGSPPLLVWNHRWDPDKAPKAFLNLCFALGDGVDFRVALAGERFVGQGDEYRPLIDRLGDRVVVDRFLSREEYDRLLVTADIAVSTAHQEFFGVSVVEAMYAGAFPVLPDRLVYPERVPMGLHDRALYRGSAHAVELLRAALEDIDATRRDAAGLRAITGAFDWGEVAPRYDDWIESMIGS